MVRKPLQLFDASAGRRKLSAGVANSCACDGSPSASSARQASARLFIGPRMAYPGGDAQARGDQGISVLSCGPGTGQERVEQLKAELKWLEAEIWLWG